MSDVTPAPSAKRPRPRLCWLKWIGIVAGALVLLGILAYSMLLFKTSRDIKREIAAIQTANEPLNWEEFQRADAQGHVHPDVQPGASGKDRSSLEYYAEAIGKCKDWSKSLGEDTAKALVHPNPDKESLDKCAAALAQYHQALDLFREAPDDGAIGVMPGSTGHFDHGLDSLSLLREAARLISTQALFCAAQGNSDEAADWCVVLCRFTREYPGDNMLGGLVHCALENVTARTIDQIQSLAPNSAGKLSTLISTLSSLDAEAQFARAMCGERVMGSGLFQTGMISRAPKFFKRPNWAAYLELLRKTISAARKPFPAAIRDMDAVADEFATRSGFLALEKGLVPALKRGVEEAARSQAKVRVTAASLALRQAKLETKAFPETLAALVPKYLQSVPLDPFTGQPLLYRLDATECVIYSVGPDGVDNGGKGVLWGIGSMAPGTDMALRIPQ